MPGFSHLHVHTEYSLLDGMSQIKDLVRHTKELGMDSLAITDHGAMYGVMHFYRACKAEGIKPIIGLEAYMAPRGMTDRDSRLDKDYTHLLLIAQNQAGYQNLLQIASASQLEGYYYKPRIDHDFLAAHAEGLICTSGCLAAEIPQMLDQGRDDEARRMLGWYWDIFGPDRFYVELQHHNIPELHAVNKKLLEIAPFAEVPLLATNDVHYVRREDADPHDILLCIGTGSLVSDSRRMRFSDNSYYMRSTEEMWQIFGDYPDSLNNTLKVAEMCDVSLDNDGYKLPVFPVPEGYDARSYLYDLCSHGLRRRYGDRADTPEVQNRLNYELEVINNMGFNDYFLIVWDLCDFAQRNDIWWNVRGSGAGSVVAYTLGITNIDPLQNGLLFERFLNPGRVTMPDIDIDYPDDRRGEMINYCVQRYGEDRVAQIITFGTMGARAALRDVGRVLDIPLNEIDRLARLIPAIPGKGVSIADVLGRNDSEDSEEKHGVPDFIAAYKDTSRPYIKRLVDSAEKLEGISRHASTHAAGVLIADAPLVQYTPLNRPTSGAEAGGLGAVSQWPMEIVESIGLLKVDFLGLATLTIMRKACELIERYHGVHYDLSSIPYRHRAADEPDAEAYNTDLRQAFMLLSQGDTAGVFQVEGAGMTRVLTEMKPSRFEHIVAAISLFRPGPLEYIPAYIRRMHGKEEVTYHHGLLEPILSETFGIIVYQEQIMQIASNLFGYELGEADLMRRAVAKKKQKDLLKHRGTFQERGPEREVDAETAGKIFDDIEFFARYGFNKSHAADYAVLTVQTAFLKAHYRHEFLTALLTIEHGNSEKVTRYLTDCRKANIEVLPPSIMSSEYEFTIEAMPDGARAIRYGLSAIKNVGDGSIAEIVRARSEKPFRDIVDFCQRTDLRTVGKRALECLIKVGALDMLGDRLRLLESLDRMMSFSTTEHKAADVGQMSMFGETTGVALGATPEDVLVNEVALQVPRREVLQWERELVGVYLSEHPLNSIMKQISQVITATSTDLDETCHDRQVAMAGVVTYVRPHTTKSGKAMAFAGIEDLYGQIEMVIWPRTWEETRDLWVQDRVLWVRGKVDSQQGEPKLLVDEARDNITVMQAISTGDNWLDDVLRRVEQDAAPIGLGPDPGPLPDLSFTDDLAAFDDPSHGYNSDASVSAGYPEEPPGLYPEESTGPANRNTDYPEEPPGLYPDTLSSNGGNDSYVGSAAENQPVGMARQAVVIPPVLTDTTPAAGTATIQPAFRRSSSATAQAGSIHMRIYIERSADERSDKRRIERIHGILHERPGNDSFTFVLMDPQRSVCISFEERTSYTGVIDKLSTISGVRVDVIR
ncbi:MAG: DNA polymerase III subunit alpha [Anaerolineae bacterium]|nr:DNA polymerase III subunit alpha [Anaerolineae bacterium]